MSLVEFADEAKPISPVCQEFDFGLVLAQGQTLRHEFALTNPTDGPIALLKATAFMPCCSSIGPMPEAIPPRGEVSVPVVYKPGHQSGLKRLEFTIDTDSEEQPARGLAVSARLVSDWEIEALEQSSPSLLVGEGGKQTFRVIAHRMAGEGRGLPDRAAASPPLSVDFLGPPTERRRSDGVIEATRDVEVIFPGMSRSGLQRGEVAFHLPDGSTRSHVIPWEVRPRLRATPSGLVLGQGQGLVRRSILVESGDSPFRILSVSGASLVGDSRPNEPSAKQRIEIELDPARAPLGRAFSLEIHTNHVHQPVVTLTVLVLPDAEGENL